MRVAKTPKAVDSSLVAFRKKRVTIGFVPTMGYLHEGHASLVRWAKKENQAVVASIFVNPLQFGPREDFRTYPRDLRRDLALLKKEGVDIVYAPSEKDFYSTDFQTSVSVGRLGRPLCGKSRPTHFAGVCTVVLKLLNQLRPARLYLGQKDYQQFKVLERMALDLDLDVEVKMCPIVREKDGLAMSSRNVFLSAGERKKAAGLYRILKQVETSIRSGRKDAGRVAREARALLKKATGARLDYLEIVDAATLSPVVKLKKRQKVLAALAVYFGQTRLIDNHLIEV